MQIWWVWWWIWENIMIDILVAVVEATSICETPIYILRPFDIVLKPTDQWRLVGVFGGWAQKKYKPICIPRI